MSAGRVLHFLVGPDRFGLRISEIAEIKEARAVTSVPGAPAAIAGLTDVRGRIVTLIDLARVFGIPSPSPLAGGLAVQLAEPFEHLGILVPGSVHEVRTTEAPGLEGAADAPTRETRGSDAALAREIVLEGSRTAFLIDVSALAGWCSARVRDQFRVTA